MSSEFKADPVVIPAIITCSEALVRSSALLELYLVDIFAFKNQERGESLTCCEL